MVRMVSKHGAKKLNSLESRGPSSAVLGGAQAIGGIYQAKNTFSFFPLHIGLNFEIAFMDDNEKGEVKFEHT